MRLLTTGVFAAGILVSQLTAAKSAQSTVEQIGAVQAAIAFCSKVDSNDVKQIERAALALLPDMTEARIEAARHTAGYLYAYQAIDSVLKGLAPSDGLRLCAAGHDPQRVSREPGRDRRR